MNIRKAFAQEAGKLAALEALQPMSAGWGKRGFETESIHNFSQIWIAETAGEPTGFVALRLVADFSEILNVAVHPAYCQKGVATAIFQRVVPELKKLGVKEVTLEVNCSNVAAIGLYHKLGFSEIGRRKKFYNNTDDALLMKLEL